jgi:hypothetical protein
VRGNVRFFFVVLSSQNNRFAFDCTSSLKEPLPDLERSLLFFSLLHFYSKGFKNEGWKHAEKPLRSTAKSRPRTAPPPKRERRRRLSWQHCESDKCDAAKRSASVESGIVAKEVGCKVFSTWLRELSYFSKQLTLNELNEEACV